MGYFDKKNKSEPAYLYFRIKNLQDLVVGNEYHLRKMIRREGSTVFDEVEDIILKSVDGNFLVDETTEEKFEVGENAFEIFEKKPI